MELFTNDTAHEYTPSDNSHLFSIPIRTQFLPTSVIIKIEMPREKYPQFVDKDTFFFLAKAGIEVNVKWL